MKEHYRLSGVKNYNDTDKLMIKSLSKQEVFQFTSNCNTSQVYSRIMPLSRRERAFAYRTNEPNNRVPFVLNDHKAPASI